MLKKIILVILVISIICFLLNACSFKFCNESSENKSKKYDLWMKKKLAIANEQDLISFSAICKNDLSLADRSKVEKTGVIINTLTGNIFTAKGTKEQIREMEKLECVTNIQGARPVKPRN